MTIRTEALDCNSEIENNGRRWVGELAQRKETSSSPFDVSGAASLQVETEPGNHSGADDYQYSQGHAHMRHCQRHSKDPSSQNYTKID